MGLELAIIVLQFVVVQFAWYKRLLVCYIQYCNLIKMLYATLIFLLPCGFLGEIPRIVFITWYEYCVML